MKLSWKEITPEEAKECGIILPHPDFEGPHNEIGEECPWPWEPQQLEGVPMGQYHCGYCGGMQVAGTPHIDWAPHMARMDETNEHLVLFYSPGFLKLHGRSRR
jgi:hypothetical protein